MRSLATPLQRPPIRGRDSGGGSSLGPARYIILQPGLALACLVVSVLVLAACGYRMGGMPCEEAMQPVRNIAVPLFGNRSLVPRAENVFTEAFREQIQDLPCFSLSSGGEADGLLKGTILSINTYTVAVNQDFLAVEYGMRAILSVSLVQRSDGKVLWRSSKVEEEVKFHAVADAQIFQDNHREALVKLSWKMAERVLDQLSLGF